LGLYPKLGFTKVAGEWLLSGVDSKMFFIIWRAMSRMEGLLTECAEKVKFWGRFTLLSFYLNFMPSFKFCPFFCIAYFRTDFGSTVSIKLRLVRCIFDAIAQKGSHCHGWCSRKYPAEWKEQIFVIVIISQNITKYQFERYNMWGILRYIIIYVTRCMYVRHACMRTDSYAFPSHSNVEIRSKYKVAGKCQCCSSVRSFALCAWLPCKLSPICKKGFSEYFRPFSCA
jgi:hypothetical protein